MVFTEAEIEYLSSQRLGRMATARPDGSLQVNPVGFSYNAELETIDVRGHGLARTRKFRNVADNGKVAFVVDDLPSLEPFQVRCLEIRGVAETVDEPADPSAGREGVMIRIHPKRIISFGVDEEFDLARRNTHNRTVG